MNIPSVLISHTLYNISMKNASDNINIFCFSSNELSNATSIHSDHNCTFIPDMNPTDL